MAQIIPTVTAENSHIYREQIERVEPFASRIHIDLMDGEFTPNRSVDITQVWWPESLTADIHVMFRNPAKLLDQLIELKPNLVIVPAESDCDLKFFAAKFTNVGIKFGIALLPETTIESVQDDLALVQHLLIFSGNLGYQGGSQANLDLLQKVQQARAVNSVLDIGWDGGVNDDNVKMIADAGVAVINAGGFIHQSDDPEAAFKNLHNLLP